MMQQGKRGPHGKQEQSDNDDAMDGRHGSSVDGDTLHQYFTTLLAG